MMGRIRRGLGRVRKLLASGTPTASKPAGRRFPLPPAEFSDGVGGGDYDAIGKHFLDLFVAHCGITPASRTLDIGCGCGRIAAPVLSYLSADTPYHGIDVILPMIEWCRQNVSTVAPNAQFHHADLLNQPYNPNGKSLAGYQLPFEDGSFDFVFLTSVFTHLLPKDTETYLGEIFRVLAPGGVAFMTFFLLNDTYEKNRAQDATAWVFDFGESPFKYHFAESPETAAAYEEVYALQLVRRAGLTIQTISYGSWNRGGGWTYQDVIVARRF